MVAEGRNRAYDDDLGKGPLRGTPLAQAELNALGAARANGVSASGRRPTVPGPP